ncbi:MAG TPA: hypothetical protein VHB98_01740, partial [Chloroflexota bacterium]|nr:hypothetical protein [Chloroflexota bacterium]
AIDADGSEGETIFETLTSSARGEHPIGAMGRHVTTALLVASRPDGWAFIERLLLAAQREEGLRQVILETVDEAHPEAFRRLLGLILDQDLIRFSATIRAADVWFGFGWDVDNARAVREALTEVRGLLDDPRARHAALAPHQGTAPEEAERASAPATATARAARKRDDDVAIVEARAAAQHVYLALWTVAFEDALAAVEAAGPLLGEADPLRRLAVVCLLDQLNLPQAQAALVPLLDDPDLRVALCAFRALHNVDATLAPDLFERYERLLARLDDNQAPLESGLWPWLTLHIGAEGVADALLRVLGERSPTLLLPHLPRMGGWGKTATAKLLAALPEWDAPIREAFFRMAGDRSSYVRDEVLELIASRPITHQEALPLEGMLTRKSSETRRALLALLLKQTDDATLASAERLVGARNPLQRLAGLDLLRELATVGRAISRCQYAARGYQETRSALSADEQSLLTAVLDAGRSEQATPTLENVLGLIDPADRTPPVAPRRLPIRVDTPAARACLVLLDELIEQQRTTPVSAKGWHGSDEQLLGNMRWFPKPEDSLTAQEDQANLPLAELWLQWNRERPSASRDDDELELVRALLLLSGSRVSHDGASHSVAQGLGAALAEAPTILHLFADLTFASLDGTTLQTLWASEVASAIDTSGGRTGTAALAGQLRRRYLVAAVLAWLVRLREPSPAGTVDLLLDSLETSLALIPPRRLEEWIAAQAAPDARGYAHADPRGDASLGLLHQHLAQHLGAWTEVHHIRHWQLLQWLDQPLPGAPRRLPALEVVLRAQHAGAANEADILDHLVAPAAAQHRYYGQAVAHDLWLLSARTVHPLLEQYPVLQRLVPLLRDRILEIELARGEM